MKFLDQYDEERKQRKRLVKESLNNPNAKKHLKFDSDDEGDNTQGKEFVEQKIQLFDNEEGVNVEEHFNPSTATKKKRKLKALQAKVSNTTDPRFQLSEQFLDEPVREEKEEEEGEDDQQQEISIADEKKKSLAILDQITNAKSSTTTKSKSKSKMIRFDPSKTEHRIYELDSEVPTNGTHASPVKETPKTSTPVV